MWKKKKINEVDVGKIITLNNKINRIVINKRVFGSLIISHILYGLLESDQIDDVLNGNFKVEIDDEDAIIIIGEDRSE
ncbi:MAG: hypothetical protein GF411_15300 [Candidatus Lokiarchaeota archaeon]|nr:hypothetical protein [Candidatus Lokiarchaeota archaeon]